MDVVSFRKIVSSIQNCDEKFSVFLRTNCDNICVSFNDCCYDVQLTCPSKSTELIMTKSRKQLER